MNPALKPLAGLHLGEPATIVGRGPSLLGLLDRDFGPGPVFTLNHAILPIRLLDLPNPIYSLQKDGCLVQPVPPEILVLSSAQSARCYRDYTPRHVVNVTWLGMATRAMSLTFAVGLAHLMGCTEAHIKACDSHHGDLRMVSSDGTKVVPGERGYIWALNQATKYASARGMRLLWE